MDSINDKELEKMIQALEGQKSVRRAGRVDARGNIYISDAQVSDFASGDTAINISLNHVMEYYIYVYYFKPDNIITCSDKPFGAYFRMYGDLCMQRQRYKAAEAAYKDSICWNPTDLDAILGLAESYKQQNMLERYLIVTKQAYRYCCTRATMARYYRNMGYYYLAKYKPNTARACYMYSNIYYHTENADKELEYIERALNDKTPETDILAIQKLLCENDIEPGPDSDTIGIIYRVGEIMLEDREYGLARDCFSIVYDITQEKDLEDLLNELEK